MGDARPRVDIQVSDGLSGEPDVHWLRELAGATLGCEGFDREVTVSLVITDDPEIRHMNKRFRGVDAPTDVLAFPSEEADGFVSPAELPSHLGDVVISYPRAVEQALEAGHRTERELALLVVHGLLHLLGYDHRDEEGRAGMWAAQDRILQQLSSRIPGA
jgi:probable rRNA maturation factor